MIGDLIRRLTEASERPLLPTDGRLAYAALMVRLARSDDSYTERERTRIDRLLAEHYGLPPERPPVCAPRPRPPRPPPPTRCSSPG